MTLTKSCLWADGASFHSVQFRYLNDLVWSEVLTVSPPVSKCLASASTYEVLLNGSSGALSNFGTVLTSPSAWLCQYYRHL